MTETQKTEKRNQLAEEIMRLSRNILLINLRFLGMALSQLQWHSCEEITLATNSKELFYCPAHILKRYCQAKEAPVRDYLHVILHCVFRHMFVYPEIDRVLWDIACDVAVENIITELRLKSTESRLEAQQTMLLSKWNVKPVTAEKVYNYLKDHQMPQEELEQLQTLFGADNHDVWYMPSGKAQSKSDNDEQKRSPESDSRENPDSENSGSDQRQNSRENGNQSYADTPMTPESLLSSSTQEAIWREIAERIQEDLETFSKAQGTQAGNLVQNLAAVNRERYDYTAFLKRFAVLNEAMKLNDDEFDYVYYTYGLQLYKKMPLIEPLEYKDIKQIREFVIAIDTSASTSGELVQLFVQKTYNILKSTESFARKINLHIIQCDNVIQEHVKITSQEDFDRYIQTMRIRGLGGTDFRPVFQKVDQLIHAKEFRNLKGLIYFTDGWGTFPEKKPPYNTAFVFLADNDFNPSVPPWAIRLVLEKEDI